LDLFIIQGPFPVAPCQTLYHDSQLFHRRTTAGGEGGGGGGGISSGMLKRTRSWLRSAPTASSCTSHVRFCRYRFKFQSNLSLGFNKTDQQRLLSI
jgi:hypothetical protein